MNRPSLGGRQTRGHDEGNRGSRWRLLSGLLIAAVTLGLSSGATAQPAPQAPPGSVVEQRIEVSSDGETREERHVMIMRKSAGEPGEAGATQVFVLATPGAHESKLKVRTRTTESDDGDAMSHSFQWVQQAPSPSGGFLGVEILPLTDALRDHFASPRGVGVLVSDVQEASPASVSGLRAGDVLTQINTDAVGSTHRFGSVMRGLPAGQRVILELWRQGVSQQIEVVLDEREHHVLQLGRRGRIVRFEGSLDDELHFDVEGAATEIREVLTSGAWKTQIDDLRAIDVEALERRIVELEQELTLLRRNAPGADASTSDRRTPPR